MNKATIHLITALSSIALLGCAGTLGSGSAKQAQSECSKLYASSKLDPIRSYIQLPISFDSPQPIELLANRSRATEAEKPAIKALSETLQECSRIAETQAGSLPAYRARSEDRVQEALADLYEGSSTYGQFARNVLYIGERDKIAREDLDEQLRIRERWRAFNEYGN